MASDETTKERPQAFTQDHEDGESSNADGVSRQSAEAGPGVTEDGALALLRSHDLLPEILVRLAKNAGLLKYRRVKLALVTHPKTPRHVSMPMVRTLFTFDLMQVALTPTVPADLKIAADEALCSRLESVSSGERLALARRASARVAGALLNDVEARVIHAALENSRLTEASVIRVLMRRDAGTAFVEAVCHHPQWSLRREVRVALLRNEKTPKARALELARGLPPRQVREVLQTSRLPGRIKAELLKDLEQRGGNSRRATRAGSS
jgi:hypothetical protein